MQLDAKLFLGLKFLNAQKFFVVVSDVHKRKIQEMSWHSANWQNLPVSLFFLKITQLFLMVFGILYIYNSSRDFGFQALFKEYILWDLVTIQWIKKAFPKVKHFEVCCKFPMCSKFHFSQFNDLKHIFRNSSISS